MTCFEIAHPPPQHYRTVDLQSKSKYKQRGEKETSKNDEKRVYSISTSHPIYITLRQKHRLGLKNKKKTAEFEFESNKDLYEEESE